MNSWSEITHYAGFDWAKDHHEAVIVDRLGQSVADFQIEHNAQGRQRWREKKWREEMGSHLNNKHIVDASPHGK